MQKKSVCSVIFSLICILIVSSCGSLPKATVDMSLLLEQQLTVLEQSHVRIIDTYFEAKQDYLLSYLDHEWYPEYLKDFLDNEEAEEIWNEIINNPDKKERISDLQMVVSIIQTEYMTVRESLLTPLENTRRELLTAVQEEYAKARTMNHAILNNITSIHEIQEARKKYISKIIDTDHMDNLLHSYLERTNNILDDIQKGVERFHETASERGSGINKSK